MTSAFPSQSTSDVENVSMAWCHKDPSVIRYCWQYSHNTGIVYPIEYTMILYFVLFWLCYQLLGALGDYNLLFRWLHGFLVQNYSGCPWQQEV